MRNRNWKRATLDILHGRLAGSNANLPRRFSTLVLGRGEEGEQKFICA